ncbi:MAG: hypothetical protein M1814_006341 [Vezdaea aestivalis]|nr:MAG: hypothetical protein M1814_006341 [Vezdaea aestivalis]
MASKTTIRVPCSSANLGPGFDCIGLALSLYLTLRITPISPAPTTPLPSNCTLSYTSSHPTSVSLHPSKNLITRTALYVLRAHNHTLFPSPIHIAIENDIPLGRGLGSSAAAVIAGVLLANTLAGLHLSRQRILDFALMVERHPDNVAPALYGGLIVAGLREVEAQKETDIPNSEAVNGAGQELETEHSASLPPTQAPNGLGLAAQFPLSPKIKIAAVIPSFEVATASARAALPESYSRTDVVFNIQRVASLAALLSAPIPDCEKIYWAMGDRMHQPYRAALVPGLSGVLETVTREKHKGLCGVCLSGAGPTILVLAVEGIELILKDVEAGFEAQGVSCTSRVLGVAKGASVERER